MNDTCLPPTRPTSWDQFDVCTKFNTTATCPANCMMYDLSKYQLQKTSPVDPAADGSCKWTPAVDPATAGSAIDTTAEAIPTAASFNTVDPCIIMKDAGSCSATAECSWEFSKPPALFTKEFCHPVKVAGTNMTKDSWTQCVSKTNAAECTQVASQCAWNNGADLVPDHDYCAPADMTQDVDLIDRCVETKDPSVCIDQCKWRKGKTVADNTALTTGADLFGANFCHPPTTAAWKEQLP